MPGFRLTTGADQGGLARVQAAFAAFAGEHALPDPVRRSVSVALDELLVNTVRYGLAGRGRGQGQEGASVAVEVELLPDRLAVTISDDGAPFDPFAVAAPDTTLPMEERRVGGLGIHLVRELMDEAGYSRKGGRNVVVMAKLLRGGK